MAVSNKLTMLDKFQLPIQIALDTHFRRLFERLVHKYHFVDLAIDGQ